MSTSQIQKRKSKRIRVSSSQKVSTTTPAPTPTLKPITPRSQSSSSSLGSSTECYLPLDDEGEAREGEDVLMLPAGPAVDNTKAKSTIKKKNTIVVVLERAYIDIKKGRLGKGKHWDHYKRYLDENDKIRAECIYCSKTFAADPKVNGTSNLTSHIGRCVENPANKTKE